MSKLEMAGKIARDSARIVFTWEWTKKLLHWLIISAGTVSECAFLLASLWMSVNASVHALVLLVMPDLLSQHITELATAAYVALPELILGLAFVVTINHIRLFLYDRKNYAALIWSVLYGLPTLVFLVLSLITLGCSVMSVNFRLPAPLIVVRALAGYMFAFTSLLYTQLGVPQERDRLQKKDGLLSALRQEKDVFIDQLRQEKDAIIERLNRESERLQGIISQQNEELQEQKGLLEESKTTQSELIKALNKSSDNALQAYSEECINWLKSGIKTASVDDINRFTGLSKGKITRAITGGILQTAPRNKDLILITSLIEWLKVTPAPGVKSEQETGAMPAITDSLQVLTPAMIHQHNGAHNGNNHSGASVKAS